MRKLCGSGETCREHREVQRVGGESIFEEYRLRVAHVLRDYGMKERSGAPQTAEVAS